MIQEENPESLDQPEMESEDQLEETDQEDVEDEEDDEQPDSEEEEDSDVYEVNGEKLTLAELKAGFMRTADYTKKTSEVAAMRREIEALKAPAATQSPEDLAAIKKLKELGIPTREEMIDQMNRAMIRKEMLNEKASVQKQLGLDDLAIEAAEYAHMKLRAQGQDESLLSVAKRLFQGDRKIVKRKTVGIKGSVASLPQSKGQMTAAKFKALDPNSKEYIKARDDYMSGKLTITT